MKKEHLRRKPLEMYKYISLDAHRILDTPVVASLDHLCTCTYFTGLEDQLCRNAFKFKAVLHINTENSDDAKSPDNLQNISLKVQGTLNSGCLLGKPDSV